MRRPAPQTSAVATCAQSKMDRITRHLAFRIAIFTTSAAVGYGFTYLFYNGLHHLPAWAAAHDKATPAIDALKTLHSGFGN